MQNNKEQINRKITVKSTTENLSKVRDFIKQGALDSGFPDVTVGQLVLAVDEACTNVIKHAYNYVPTGRITIKIKFEKKKFAVTILDDGSHFNPDIIPEPDIKEYYKQRKAGGLGMFLMKKLMDDISYKTTSGNGNKVVLVKYL